MRTRSDRIRHAILYEIILLAMLIPLSSLALHQTTSKIGLMAITISLFAMVWNYIFNLGFDKTLNFMDYPLYPRGFRIRTLHAFLFECGLVLVTVPAMMWWLQLSLWQAVVMDLAFLLLVPIYTLAYNWLYDQLFPIPAYVNTDY